MDENVMTELHRDRFARRGDPLAYFLQSGSPRVFNCLRIGNALNAAGDPTAKLLFQTPLLNNSVLFKDRRDTKIGTRIFVPFDVKRPNDGGETFFFDAADFAQAMGKFVDLRDPKRYAGLAADVEVIEVLDTLPSFAPFLLRDRFDHAGLDADPAYSRIAEWERQEIERFIRGRFQQVLSAVAGARTPTASTALNRLLDKLWDLTDLPALKALADALGLPTADCINHFRAWKGTLYFAWTLEAVQKYVLDMSTWLVDWPRLAHAVPAPLREATALKFEELHLVLDAKLHAVERILAEYDEACNDLLVRKTGPRRFVNFLVTVPSRFSECGITMGILQHAHEVWHGLTEPFPNRGADHRTIGEVLHAVNDVFGGPRAEIAA